MKKFLLSLVALIGAVSVNAQNNLYIEVGESDNTAKIPVYIYMTNDTTIIGIQASYALPEGLTYKNFINNGDEEEVDCITLSERCATTFTRYKVEMFTKSKPNDLLFSTTAGTTSRVIGEGSGLIGTFYFDGSSLTDGTYEVTQYTATIFPGASERYDIDSRDSDDDDVKASFTIQDGKVTGTSTAINEINANGNAAKGIYNIAGQRLNTLQKGLNIVDGKKVYVK